MDLLPAVDIRHGAAVRLTQGDFDRGQHYGDPLDLARSYAAAGAGWVHVVDLDAARSGRPVNRGVVLAIVDEVDARIEVGGGIRSADDVAELLDGGAARVVMGTVAVTDPDLLTDLALAYPGRIVVGIDHRGGGSDVAVSGWEQAGGTTLTELLDRLAPLPLAAVVVTAIERDGTLEGPDLPGLRAVLEATDLPVVASGGVRSVADLVALAALEGRGRPLDGVIVGKALVEGVLDLEEALAACAASE